MRAQAQHTQSNRGRGTELLVVIVLLAVHSNVDHEASAAPKDSQQLRKVSCQLQIGVSGHSIPSESDDHSTGCGATEADDLMAPQ